MRKIILLSAAATLLACGGIYATPALAFPPTATISPGYDRALALSRRAQGTGEPSIYAPAPRGYYAERPYPRMKRQYRRY